LGSVDISTHPILRASKSVVENPNPGVAGYTGVVERDAEAVMKRGPISECPAFGSKINRVNAGERTNPKSAR
jgi:hypothetical protein